MYGTFFCREGDLIFKQLTKYSAHTRNEVAMLGSLIREGDNILDIGAHIGTFAIPFARFSKGKGRVFSFEGHPENYKLLLQNIEINNLQGQIWPVNAVVAETEEAGLSVRLPDDSNTGAYYFQPGEESTGEGLRSVNIDSWYARQDGDFPLALVKVDVEGAEVSVLRSCMNLLSGQLPALYIEINAQALRRFGHSARDIAAILEPLGYHYFRNISARNSTNDEFRIASLSNIEAGGGFFDLLAIHPSDSRYPEHCAGGLAVAAFRAKAAVTGVGKRLRNRLVPDAG